MKKLGLLFAVVVMSLMFAVSVSALEPTGQCGDNVYWEYDETTGELVISGEGPMTDYDFEDNSYFLYSTSPFYDSNIKSVVIESGVTTIGDYAFYYCYNLTSVTIGDSVTTIGDFAFMSCNSLTSITISDSVTTISTCAFAECDSLTSVTIGDNVTTIGNYAFQSCDRLTSITIPDSVTTIGDRAFKGCYRLASLTIGDGVTTIGDYAFYGCEILTSITIPDGVTTIGEYAFSSCSSLKSITVDADNTAFSSDCNGVLFDKNKTTLIQYPAGNISSSYIIPDSVTTIGLGAFAFCHNLTSITIPDNVTTIDYCAFYECTSLTSVILPDSVTIIGMMAFYYCTSITDLTIGNGLTKISDGAFIFCESLTDVTITGSVETIGNGAFGMCTSLRNVTIPDSVTTIDTQAFYGCSALADVYYNGTEEQWKTIYIGIENEDLLNATIHFHTHTYIPEITTPATHLKEGVETFLCQCGDKYTKTISKIAEHTYTSSVTTQPTHLDEGIRTYTCECTHSYTESISKLTEHTYIPTLTPPTCTTPGYTTYTCECGDKYFDNFVDERHTFSDEWTIDEDPTCKYEGIKSRHCEFCPARTDITAIGKLAHNFVSVRIEPSCVDDGCIMTGCNCGEEIIETIPATGHNIVGSACTECDYDKSFDCSCNCHKSGIPHLIFKIILFFQKLFGQNKVCACGVKH